MILTKLVQGGRKNLRIQCWAEGGVTPYVFEADDVLSASVYPARNPASVISPTMSFYTANSTQTGYDQGQVDVAFSVAQFALLQPGIRYQIDVGRTPAAGGDIDWVAIAQFDFVGVAG